MNVTFEPLISVVIAFLNEEKFLAEAVESVLTQDYTQWELYLVDDGSTDHSTMIAKGYAAQYPDKIHYCEHESHQNKGLSASRNHGICQGRGSLIALLDADDVWLPSKLSAQVMIFKQHPAIGMVAEASLYWYSWDTSNKQDELTPIGAPGDAIYCPVDLLLMLYPLTMAAAPCPSSMMFTRKAFFTVGGFEETFTQLYEDQVFLSKIYLKEKVYISTLCNNMYRQRTGSIMFKVNGTNHYHIVRRVYLEWLVTYLKESNAAQPKVMQAVTKALFRYRHPLLYRIRELSLRQAVKNMVRK